MTSQEEPNLCARKLSNKKVGNIPTIKYGKGWTISFLKGYPSEMDRHKITPNCCQVTQNSLKGGESSPPRYERIKINPFDQTFYFLNI